LGLETELFEIGVGGEVGDELEAERLPLVIAIHVK